MQVNKQERVEWIDFFKVIAIILVVTGHATGYFNPYIYQFHMAAFFFISGYCVNWMNKGKLWNLWKKFYTLLVPLTVIFLAGVIGMYLLYSAGIYNKIWGANVAYIGVKNMLVQYFLYNRNYVWWMGACWFLKVLFLIHLIHSILWKMIEKKEKYCWQIFIVCIVSLYFIGIYCSRSEIHMWDIDLAFIGQLYYGVGTICKNKSKYAKKAKHAGAFEIILLFVSSVLLIEFSKISNITVDYPSRDFHHCFLGILTACNGIIWVSACSKILEKLLKKTKVFKQCLLLIGRNTISIVFFHFLLFKLSYMILILFKVVDRSYISNFTPTDPIGRNYLLLFLIVSILGSISIWRGLAVSKIGKILLGQDREFCTAIYDQYSENFFVGKRKLADLFDLIVGGRRKLKQIPFSYKIAGFFSFIYMMITFWPLTEQGIILNDELQAGLNRKYGFMFMLKEGMKNEIRMGRPLRIMAAFDEAANFLTNHMQINKLIQIAILFVTILLFSRLIYEIYKNKTIALLSMLFIIIFMPVTFEHAAPNAFTGLAAIPLEWLFISLTVWCRYLWSQRKIDMAIVLLCWIFALLGYEYMVTYTPLFLLLYAVKRKQSDKSVKDCIHTCVLPVSVACIYLCSLFLFSKIINVQYDGVKIGFVSLRSSWDIVKTLVQSSLPGYYLFNAKYRYLVYILTGEKYLGLYQFINNPKLDAVVTVKSQMLEFLSIHVVSIRMILWILSTITILWFVLTRGKILHNTKQIWTEAAVTITSLLLYMFIPVLPNAVSSIYQGMVSENFFTSLPVSLALVFTVCLLFSYIVFLLVGFLKRRRLFVLFIVCFILFIAVPVQTMNTIIGAEQKANYKRLTEIEALLKTECMRNIDNSTIYAKDFFETKNTLSVHESYWDSLSALYGLHIVFLQDAEADYQVYYTDSTYFCIIGKSEMAVLSREKLPEKFKLQTGENDFCLVDSENFYWDNGFLCYRFSLDGSAILDDGALAFEREYKSVGNTLSTSNIIQGYYEDGWVNRTSEFEIYSGDSGRIKIEGYLPENLVEKLDDEEYKISVFVDDKEMIQKQIQEGCFTIYVQAKPQNVVKIKLLSNFSVAAENGDVRELSFLLNSLKSN